MRRRALITAGGMTALLTVTGLLPRRPRAGSANEAEIAALEDGWRALYPAGETPTYVDELY